MSFPFPPEPRGPGDVDFSLAQDLSQEDILDFALRRVERRQYWDRLDPKQRGDVTIALAYLFRCYQAGKQGSRPSAALNEREWKFVTRMVNDHRRFFTGGTAFDQFLV